MRNVPFAFLNEETIDRINRAERAHAAGQVQVDAFAHLAETQKSMRGVIALPTGSAWKTIAGRFVAMLERMMEMSGPNSIANLERALRAHREAPRATEE